MPRSSQRPKPTTEQRAVARERTDLMWKSIQQQRESYNESIMQLATDHSKSEQWVATQLFRGGKVLSERRKKSLYNALVHDIAKKRKEDGRPTEGRQTLKSVAQEAAMVDLESLPKEEQDRLLNQLEESRQERPVTKVPKKTAGIEIEGVLRRIQPELEGLMQRTGAQYLLFMTKGEVTDNWAIRVAATPKVVEACMQLFKCTPEEMAMKIEAYVTAGLSGVIQATGKKRYTLLKSEIRAKTLEGFRGILTEKGISDGELPSAMQWAHYEQLVCTYGVELVGWTEGDIRNPGSFNLVSQLERLHAAMHVNPPTCYWVILEDEAWEAKKAARRNAILKGKNRASTSSTAMDLDDPLAGVEDDD